MKFTGVKVYETAYRHVAPGLFVGAGLDLQLALERLAPAIAAHNFGVTGTMAVAMILFTLYQAIFNPLVGKYLWMRHR